MIAIDIETAKDDLETSQEGWYVSKRADKRLKDPAKIKANGERVMESFPLSPLTGKIILIGIISDSNIGDMLKANTDAPGTFVLQIGLDGKTEKEMLETFWNIISTGMARGHRLVTFNGKKFDLPFIFARSLFTGVPKPNSLRTMDSFLNKYNTVAHVDVFVTVGEKGSQSEWANKLLPDEPLSSDGHLIPKWYTEGMYDEIISKNYLDLKQLFYLYKKMEIWV